jgi:hypothetical protein
VKPSSQEKFASLERVDGVKKASIAVEVGSVVAAMADLMGLVSAEKNMKGEGARADLMRLMVSAEKNMKGEGARG